MNARKEFNRAAAKEARKSGVYDVVMGQWDRLDRTLTPKAAVQALAMLLDPAEPAKASKKTASKATKKAAPEQAFELRYALTLTALKIHAAIEAGMEAPSESEDRYAVTLTVDGRYKAAKALREAGFAVKDGKAVIHVNAGMAGAREVAARLGVLLRECGMRGSEPGQVSQIDVTA